MTMPKAYWPCPDCKRNIGVYYKDAVNRNKLVLVKHYPTNTPVHGDTFCSGSGYEFTYPKAKPESVRSRVKAPEQVQSVATAFTLCRRCSKRVSVRSSPQGLVTSTHTFTSSGSECAGSGQPISFKDVS